MFEQRLWGMFKRGRAAGSELGIGSDHRGTQIIVDGLLEFDFLGDWNEACDETEEKSRIVLGDVFEIAVPVIHIIEDAKYGLFHRF